MGDEPEIDGPPVLPVPDGGDRHTDLSGDIFLIQSKFKTTTAQVVAEGGGFLSELGKRRNLKRNCDFIGRSDRFEILGKGVHTPIFVEDSENLTTLAAVLR